MGYTADLTYVITFPSQEALDAVIAEVKGQRLGDDEDFTAIIDAISEYHDWDQDPEDPLTFRGWGNGKLLWDHEEILKMLADANVTGFIDGRGEDESLWRWRFAEGEYKDYYGQITFPDDPYDKDNQ